MGVRAVLASPKTAKFLFASGLAETGVAVTIVTAFLLVSQGSIFDFRFWEYGFPFTWRYITDYGGTSLNWFGFLLDSVFYVSVGYVVMIAYRGASRGWKMKAPLLFLVAAVYVMVAMAWFTLITWADTHTLGVLVLSPQSLLIVS